MLVLILINVSNWNEGLVEKGNRWSYHEDSRSFLRRPKGRGDLLARRWIFLRTIASTYHASERESAVLNTRECIQNLILVHGDHFEFGPDGDCLVPLPGVTSSQLVAMDEGPADDNASCGSSQRTCAQHQFKFLQTRGEVWTCLQVGVTKIYSNILNNFVSSWREWLYITVKHLRHCLCVCVPF